MAGRLLHDLDQNNTRVHMGNIYTSKYPYVTRIYTLVIRRLLPVCTSQDQLWGYSLGDFQPRQKPKPSSALRWLALFVNNTITVKALSLDIRLGSISASLSGPRELVSRTVAGNQA